MYSSDDFDDVKKQSQLKEFWRRLKKSKTAVFGLVVIILLILMAVFAEFIAPFHYDDQDLTRRFQFPNSTHWLGTDNFGRDILSRLIFGSRISLQVGLISVGIAASFGAALGAISAFYGRWIDHVIMRSMDMLLAIPGMLLAIAIASALGPGLRNMMIAIGISSIPGFARVVRSSVLTIKEQEYIEAAQSIGASNFRIIMKHIMPNAMAPLLVQTTLSVAGAVLSAAALSFLGLGIQPPTPEWGAMLSAARQFIRDYWHLTTFPGLMIMLTVYALNVFGDGLRDALDPRLKD